MWYVKSAQSKTPRSPFERMSAVTSVADPDPNPDSPFLGLPDPDPALDPDPDPSITMQK